VSAGDSDFRFYKRGRRLAINAENCVFPLVVRVVRARFENGWRLVGCAATKIEHLSSNYRDSRFPFLQIPVGRSRCQEQARHRFAADSLKRACSGKRSLSRVQQVAPSRSGHEVLVASDPRTVSNPTAASAAAANNAMMMTMMIARR